MSDLLSRDDLPPILQEVADLIGVELTLRLVSEFGGWRVYVPKNLTDDCELTRAIGLDAARAVATAWAGQFLWVPKCVAAQRAQRDAEIIRRFAAGEKVTSLAREFGISGRHVYVILAQHAD